MRGFVLLILLVSSTSFAQKNANTLRLGLNRIGLFFEPSYTRSVQHHDFTAGLKFYAQDQVFERSFPGMMIAYDYQFLDGQSTLNFRLGLSSSAFSEFKTSNHLILLDNMVRLSVDIRFAKRFNFHIQPEIGMVNNIVVGETEDVVGYHYLNYGLAIGIKYYWGRTDQ